MLVIGELWNITLQNQWKAIDSPSTGNFHNWAALSMNMFKLILLNFFWLSGAYRSRHGFPLFSTRLPNLGKRRQHISCLGEDLAAILSKSNHIDSMYYSLKSYNWHCLHIGVLLLKSFSELLTMQLTKNEENLYNSRSTGTILASENSRIIVILTGKQRKHLEAFLVC